jgi:hypothetical protein
VKRAHALLVAGALAALALPPRAGAGPAPAASPYAARVVEVGRTVDLTRGAREWLVVTVEVTAPGEKPAPLRAVQPLRDHFTLEDPAGNRYRCSWLKGGTSLENPAVLRFQAGFELPPPTVARVVLTLLLPRPQPEQTVEFRFKSAELSRLPVTAAAAGGSITITAAGEQAYTPPALPPGGRFSIKAPPVDYRLFQRPARPDEKQPERAQLVTWRSDTVFLFDRALDLDGFATGPDGRRLPLLSAMLERHPSRAAPDRAQRPHLEGRYWFQLPLKGAPGALTLQFTLRGDEKQHVPVRIEGLPVPGR